MAKKSFNLYKSWYPLIEALYSQSPENVGALFMAIMAYQNDGTEPDITSPIYSHFCLMKQKFEEDNEAYVNACESYRENGKKGGRPKKQAEPNETKENQSGFSETKPNQTKPDTDTDTVTVTDTVSPTEIKKETPTESRKKFSPPSVEDVKAYCQERENKVDAETFVDFYTAKGWKVGNNPMKDWKACVRTWEKREDGRASPNKPVTKFTNFEERKYDFKELEKRFARN